MIKQEAWEEGYDGSHNGATMTIDLSVVKRIAKPHQWNGGRVEGWTFNTEAQLMGFAQAIYAMGAAEQKEKDTKICEEMRGADWATMSEAIRSQE